MIPKPAPMPVRDIAPRQSPIAVEPLRGDVGVLVTDFDFKPFYASQIAVKILRFPLGVTDNTPAFMQARLRGIFTVDRYQPQSPCAVEFTSGSRRYLCRASTMHVWNDQESGPACALVLERLQKPFGLFETVRRFHLSPRECETVRHIIGGLTTKEIAAQMSVSPNTVKQFVRILMTKMRVTTRAGIAGKILRD